MTPVYVKNCHKILLKIAHNCQAWSLHSKGLQQMDETVV